MSHNYITTWPYMAKYYFNKTYSKFKWIRFEHIVSKWENIILIVWFYEVFLIKY